MPHLAIHMFQLASYNIHLLTKPKYTDKLIVTGSGYPFSSPPRCTILPFSVLAANHSPSQVFIQSIGYLIVMMQHLLDLDCLIWSFCLLIPTNGNHENTVIHPGLDVIQV